MSDSDAVAKLAADFRQSVRGCAAHTVGPVRTFARCTRLRREGALSDEEFFEVGRHIVARSQDVIDEARAQVDDPAAVEGILGREQAIIDFVVALFALEPVR